MLDLTIATNCIRIMRENRTYRDHKIGIVKSESYDAKVTSIPGYPIGKVVLFRDELNPSDSQLYIDEYREMKQKTTGRVTIEIPLSQEEIDNRKEKRSLITTMCTMVGVPKSCLEEIRI